MPIFSSYAFKGGDGGGGGGGGYPDLFVKLVFKIAVAQ